MRVVCAVIELMEVVVQKFNRNTGNGAYVRQNLGLVMGIKR